MHGGQKWHTRRRKKGDAQSRSSLGEKSRTLELEGLPCGSLQWFPLFLSPKLLSLFLERTKQHMFLMVTMILCVPFGCVCVCGGPATSGRTSTGGPRVLAEKITHIMCDDVCLVDASLFTAHTFTTPPTKTPTVHINLNNIFYGLCASHLQQRALPLLKISSGCWAH